MGEEEAGDPGDPNNLRRFLSAQEGIFDRALNEIRAGEKRTHWIWFIFPQVEGLGHSSTSRKYAIRSQRQASAYLDHPVLGPRLRQCAEAALAVEDRTALEIFGSPDDLKLRSSMTLFAAVAGPGSVFSRVLEKYFQGLPDARTLDILARIGQRMG